MPIEVGIWKLGTKLERVRIHPLDSEAKLEDSICEDLSIIAPDLMLIGRQIPTDYGKFIDLLAMDVGGNLTVIELKRDRTPREVVAQVLDYASWVQNLSYDEIAELYASKNDGKALEAGFAEAFDTSPPEKLNESHNLIIVASELDAATERIINYLTNNYGVPINAIFFQCFKDGESEFLTRTWLIDPQEAETKTSRAATKKDREPWNGQDFYVSFGDGTAEGEGVHRSWEDAHLHRRILRMPDREDQFEVRVVLGERRAKVVGQPEVRPGQRRGDRDGRPRLRLRRIAHGPVLPGRPHGQHGEHQRPRQKRQQQD
jgi:hypothetical protein